MYVLHGGLRLQMGLGRQRMRIDEIIRKRCVGAMHPAVQVGGVIHYLVLFVAAVGQQHVAGEFVPEHRLDSGGGIAGQERDRAGRRDRGHQRIPHAMRGDGVPHIRIERGDRLPGEILVLVESGKAPFSAAIAVEAR